MNQLRSSGLPEHPAPEPVTEWRQPVIDNTSGQEKNWATGLKARALHIGEQWTEATMAPQLSIHVLHTDGTAIVRLAGELDVAVAPQLRDAVRGLRGRVTVDARELTFMDAAGLG